MEKLNLTPDNINEASWKTFMCIGYGRTASSPVLAKQLAMLRDSDDYLMNRDRLLPSALDYINNGSSTSSGESAKATHYDRPTLTMPGREVYQEMAEWLDKGHAKGMRIKMNTNMQLPSMYDSLAESIGSEANYVPLTPISFLSRTADIYPDHPSLNLR
ncbi:hypothetical protein GQR58_027373 [Nymphon striatum]|nr:hypothetical protein GQR58_027373 [Nymphon striatum]